MQNTSGLPPHQPYQNVKLDECHICLDPLVGELAEVSCGHIYHYQCLVNWTTKNGTHRACCICDQNTEIINIITLPPVKNYLPSSVNINENLSRNTNGPRENDVILPESRIKKYICCQIL